MMTFAVCGMLAASSATATPNVGGHKLAFDDLVNSAVHSGMKIVEEVDSAFDTAVLSGRKLANVFADGPEAEYESRKLASHGGASGPHGPAPAPAPAAVSSASMVLSGSLAGVVAITIGFMLF